MMLPLYQVDAFTNTLFGGNPAAVCPLDAWLPETTMQAIAAENNLAETAFFVREGGDYALRWFTPAVEVDLCGHATLASGHIVFQFLEPQRDSVSFRTMKAGTLSVTRRAADLLEMDFPARPPVAVETPPGARGGARRQAERGAARARPSRRLRQRRRGRRARSRFRRARQGGLLGRYRHGAPRFFAPAQGVNEDPATGSSHCTLAPYWADRLGKTELEARQLSQRGGALRCAVHGDRVKIAGRAVLYLEGRIAV
jgi:predicted PhzF superfamily epimerase YddE/YHI9